MRVELGAAICLMVAAACGPARIPLASDYDQSCASVADCVTLFIGKSDCCDNLCANAAVRATEAERAAQSVSAASGCGMKSLSCNVGPCAQSRVQCVQGQCVLATAGGNDDASAKE